MKKQDLENKLKKAEADYNTIRYGIYKEYALANNPYKIGDVVTDHFGSLKIESIKVKVTWGEPVCVYEGIRLNKDGKPSKKQGEPVFQSNIK